MFSIGSRESRVLGHKSFTFYFSILSLSQLKVEITCTYIWQSSISKYDQVNYERENLGTNKEFGCQLYLMHTCLELVS